MNLKYKILPLLLLVAFIGCASLEVSHDYDSTADFTKLKTFDWIPMKKQAGAKELTAKISISNRSEISSTTPRNPYRSLSSKKIFLSSFPRDIT